MKSKFNFTNIFTTRLLAPVFLILMFFISSVFSPLFFDKTADAKKIELAINNTDSILCDEADILTEYDEVNIMEKLEEHDKNSNIQYLFITTDETSDYQIGHEPEGIYKDHHAYLVADGIVIFLISTNPDNPICTLKSYKEAVDKFTPDICELISTNIAALVQEGAYSESFDMLFDYINDVESGIIVPEDNTTKTHGYDNIQELLFGHMAQTIILLFGCIIISAIFVAVIVFKSDKNVKPAPIQSKTTLLEKKNTYIRTVTNRYR